AGLAADEDGAGLAGVRPRERGLDRGQLIASANERRARETPHALILVRLRRSPPPGPERRLESHQVPGLVSPPVARALDVIARSVTEIGRADHKELEPLRPGLVAAPRLRWDAYRIPLFEL